MIQVVIKGAKRAPNWTTIQEMLREATNDEQALLTRIARQDRKSDYQATGTYDLRLSGTWYDEPVKLIVE